jgi:putative ABC transport system ATP-binding protein
MADEVIRVADLVKIYRMGDVEVRALDGVTLSVGQGEFVAVMGSSGSGKSTFMNIIGCLDRPTSGKYRLDGEDVSELSRDDRAEIRNAKIGFVFQSFNLLSRTSAIENVELPLLYARDTHAADHRAEKARRCLAMVGLTGREDHLPNQLSGGQQQRVAIARAMINDPAIELADMSVFQALNARGKTIVLITHEPDIAKFARRMVVFKDGRVLSDEPVEQRRVGTAAPVSAEGATA